MSGNGSLKTRPLGCPHVLGALPVLLSAPPIAAHPRVSIRPTSRVRVGMRAFGLSQLNPAFVGILLAFASGSLTAQTRSNDEQALFREVMPLAESFSEKAGDPPVARAYRVDSSNGDTTLVGYLFLTSDVPPEEVGYSAPITVLVGIDLDGTLTGARVVRYRESIRRVWGDFLRRRGVQEQYAGKPISDPFMVGRDVDGITRASITMSAMSRGIRNAARRVAAAHFPADGDEALAAADGSSVAERLDGVSWPELFASGVAVSITVSADNIAGLEMSFAYFGDSDLGSILVGASGYTEALAALGERADGNHIFLIGLDGSFLNMFDPEALRVLQGADTVAISRDDFFFLGEPREGVIAGQVQFVGVLLVDRKFDIAFPLTFEYDVRPALGLFSTEYAVPGEMLVTDGASAAPIVAAPLPPPSLATTPATVEEEASEELPVTVPAVPETTREVDLSAAPPAPIAPVITIAPESELGREDSSVEQDTVLGRLITEIAWSRVAPLLVLLAVVMFAFLSKNTTARWVSLAGTLAYLGFVDGGFLSISHITSGITTGLSVYVSDLSLLLVVTFTVVTTLLWGRVLCGFLCPFGALQDLLERVVPRRVRRKIPPQLHKSAIYLKYLILGLIVVLAVVASDVSVFQYFEPFGTVFFLSRSWLLWAIAVGILAASAVIPRFYCRYLCPLGAALGLASLLAPFRIKRVDACDNCKTCEKSCPTGAIKGPAIDFKECVRCDVCEVKLLTRAGVCRKLSMGDILVQLSRSSSARQRTPAQLELPNA